MNVSAPAHDEVKQPEQPKLRDVLGPGLITGASDDDPSGIATYSQAGAQFGYSLGWTLLLTYPLMCAIQMTSAQIGRVTGRGLAGNMRRHYPAPLLYVLIGMLIVANAINIGADLGAMAAALRLLVSGPILLYAAAFAAVTVLLEVFMRYARYASVLRWLTLSLFAYVGTVFAVGVPWMTVARNLVLPHLEFSGSYLTVVVAIFGTTISPYLFFWQAGEEVEGEKEDPQAKPLGEAPEQPTCAYPTRHARRHGALEHHRSLHRVDDRGDIERPWNKRHSNVLTSCRSVAADRRRIRVRRVCVWHHRRRDARRASAGGKRRLCGWRSVG